MFLHLLCGPFALQASSQALNMISEESCAAGDPDDFEGSEFDLDDGPLDFDPSIGEADVLGDFRLDDDFGLDDFGLNDEPTEPEFGDFWIDSHELWD